MDTLIRSARDPAWHCGLLSIGLIVALISLAAYHPAYFGDELTPFAFADMSSERFWGAFASLNHYKPRLIFNAIWSVIAAQGWPRWVPAVFTAAALFGCSAIAYRLAQSILSCRPAVCWLLAIVIATSRFAVMLKYDYIAGLIETASFFFLLAAVYLVLRRAQHGSAPIYSATFFSVLAVLTHERYIAATVALGVAAGVLPLFRRVERKGHWLAAAFAIALVPAATFALGTHFYDSLPISTGTAGTKVTLGLGNVAAFGTYLLNVFAGANFGHPWFVGTLAGSGSRALLQPAVMVMVGGAWVIWAFFSLRKPRWEMLVFGICAMALVAAASLPGLERQEARWMFPVAGLAGLIAACAPYSWARIVVLGSMLAANSVYICFGHNELIFNIAASLNAKTLTSGLTNVGPTGKTGIVIGAPEPDISWVIRGVNFGGAWNESPGRTFSRYSLRDRMRIYPASAVTSGANDYDFGVVAIPLTDGQGRFSVIDKAHVTALLHPSFIGASEGRVLGEAHLWGTWTWNQAMRADQPVDLRPGVSGMRKVPAGELDGKIIVYRAYSLGKGAVPMRLQVNWVNDKDALLDATIQVVQVTSEESNYSALLRAPPSAAAGYVYATLHDAASGSVRLTSVRLLD